MNLVNILLTRCYVLCISEIVVIILTQYDIRIHII